MKWPPLLYVAPKQIQADYQREKKKKRGPDHFDFYLKQRKPVLPPCI